MLQALLPSLTGEDRAIAHAFLIGYTRGFDVGGRTYWNDRRKAWLSPRRPPLDEPPVGGEMAP